MNENIRILIARLGLDAHWRGSMVVARALRDAGMEVVYVGNQMPPSIVAAALDEDADVVGLSSLSGNHIVLAPEVVRMLRERGTKYVPVILGGTIPRDDWPTLKDSGIAAVFGPGSSLHEIVSFIRTVHDAQKCKN